MARKRRVIQSGYCYHVLVRGIGGRDIFEDDFDRARFCLLLQYAAFQGKFSIHGFCLMSNHVHLLVQAQSKALSTGMHSLLFRYAQYYNKKIERQGYLFQSRFKAIFVEGGIYLRRLIRYIHRNPVRAHLVDSPEAYRWSSHCAYLLDFQDVTTYTWLNTDLIMSLFGDTAPIAKRAFESYISSDDNEAKDELNEIRKATSLGAYGSAPFVEEYQRFLEPAVSMITIEPEEKALNIETIIHEISRSLNTSLSELQSTNKAQEIVQARALFAWVYTKLNLGKSSSLSDLLRRYPTSVARLIDKVNESEFLRNEAADLLAKIQN